jgi:hypothetical protein
MDLSPLNSASSAPLTASAPARQAQAAAPGVAAGSSEAAAASTASARTVLADSTRTQTVQRNERPAEQNADQNTLDNANAGILFEYRDGTRVMKVNDSKGVLIYQVPPKGELQLVLEQERQARMLETQA